MGARRCILIALLALSPACRRAEVVATKDEIPPRKPSAAPVEASYFPLVVGAVYEYDGEFDGKKMHSSIVVRDGDAAVGRVFTESFGLGAYRVTDDAVETAEAFWREDLAKVSAMSTALRLPPMKGATVTLEGTHQLEVSVVGPESVSVPAGTYACVRIDEREIWPDTTYEGAVWLSRGVGVVKRLYVTGRIDVLTRVRFP